MITTARKTLSTPADNLVAADWDNTHATSTRTVVRSCAAFFRPMRARRWPLAIRTTHNSAAAS